MESTTTTKKKKRRTRKCLNDIRKRSRRSIGGEYLRQTTHQQHDNPSKIEEHQTHRLITLNRLTINMFPRAIQSETVTRPLLQEIKQKSLLKCLDADKKSSSCNTPLKESETHWLKHSNSAASKNSMPMFDLEEELQQGYISSPTDHDSNMHALSGNMMETTTKPLTIKHTTSSQSSNASDEDHSHILYDELMNTISSHLNNITSTVIKEDIMRSTKISLQKLRKNQNKSCNMPKEFNNITQSSKDSIVQKPLEYIRHKHLEQQGVYENGSGLPLSGESTPAESAPHSPELHKISSGTTCDDTLLDTPEYNYFPHRLN